MPVGGGVICRPVVAERGLSGASLLVGPYSRRVALSEPHAPLCRENSGFRENRGTNMTENAQFRIEKAWPRVPSSAGYFFDFRELETQWVL